MLVRPQICFHCFVNTFSATVIDNINNVLFIIAGQGCKLNILFTYSLQNYLMMKQFYKSTLFIQPKVAKLNI